MVGSSTNVTGWWIWRDGSHFAQVTSAPTRQWFDDPVSGASYTYAVSAYGPGGESSASASPIAAANAGRRSASGPGSRLSATTYPPSYADR